MKIKDEIRSLVIVGSWNTLLFTGKWLNDNIFDGALDPKIKLEIAINGNNVTHRTFQLPNYKLEISQERLCFILKIFDQDHYDILLEDATKLLTKLQHTPLKKLGLNFIYYDEIDEPFEKAKNFYQLENIIQANEIISMQRSNYTLRLSINRKSNYTEFNFNYTHNIKDSAEAKGILQQGIFEEYKQDSERIVNYIMEKYHE